jgi:hypothetical protein
MRRKFWLRRPLQTFILKAEQFSDCLLKVRSFSNKFWLFRQTIYVPGVIEMVYGREAVLQAEAQAQMLQGRKDLVDDSHVSLMSLISCEQFFCN